jgi:exopolysaccharide/PEP-CTERM locus tyrosine autokinase
LSKIHKALEKAQREKERSPQRDFLLVPDVEEEKKEKPEKPLVPRAPRVVEGIAANQRLVAYYEPGSLAAEQFRKLRTQLLRLRLSRPPRTILVTSATAGEGKTLVAANLAAGIAYDLNAYALLVDCDLRNPSLGQWFSLNNGYGLADYLIGKKEIPELLLKTEVEKLKVLLSGTMQDNPTELIGSAKMEALIQEFKSRYNDRYVILDSPPLLSTSEPEVLSKFVDGIVIVVRAGVTPRENLKQAISSLEKEKILGFVLNDLQFKCAGLSSRYFGSDYSYKEYGYGKRRREKK